MSTPTYINLYDILPHILIDYDNYFESEPKIKEKLALAGYHPNGNFYTGERDSWSPLSRVISTTGEDGEVYYIWYG